MRRDGNALEGLPGAVEEALDLHRGLRADLPDDDGKVADSPAVDGEFGEDVLTRGRQVERVVVVDGASLDAQVELVVVAILVMNGLPGFGMTCDPVGEFTVLAPVDGR